MHKFEYQMMEKRDNIYRLQAAAHTTNLLEVFVDDFIAATNNTKEAHLQHFTKAILHGIHSVFPPPEITQHPGEDPISQKKMMQGDGTWCTTKEILGWIVDGAAFTIQLPPSKCEKITKLIKKVKKMKACSLQTYQEVAGKLQHASFAIPGGKDLLSPVHAALHGNPPFITITPILKQALHDWRAVVQYLAKHPTPVSLLVPQYPNYLQYTVACRIGAGGVICLGLDETKYIVWKFQWPTKITNLFDKGTLTINDLELAGLVLGWLVLEYITPDLAYKHVGSFCDNTSAVAWAQKGHTTTSIPAARLLRFLSIRQRAHRTSSLLPIHIPGENNDMADFFSRAFKQGKFYLENSTLLSFFSKHFPLPQKKSWSEWKVHKKLSMQVTSCLLGEQLQMESLLNLPRLGKNIGGTGCPTPTPSKPTPTSEENPTSTKPSSSQGMLLGSGQELMASEMRSKFKPSQMHWRPSPRPLNWLENSAPSTKPQKHTLPPSRGA